jgi:hypothetical protein
VGADQRTVVVTGKDKKDVTVTVNKDAKITLDGKKTKLADLKEGQTVKVAHVDNKVSEVKAKSAKEE